MRRQVLRFMLAVVAALALGGAPAWGQTEPPCLMPNCDKLMIEAIRVYDNVATTCTDNDVPCGDRFSQMFFKIYLRMEVPAGTAPFNLDYSTLDVSVRLKNANQPIQYSHINIPATDNCFKTSTNGAKWFGFGDPDGNKVIWEPTEKEVAISFANLDPNGPNCGVTAPGGLSTNQIGFAFDQPDCTAACGSLSVSCAYVELFTVVVNAYPGETVALEIGERMYVPKSDPTSNCSPIGVVNETPNLNCLAVFNGSPIAAPPTFASTANANIEAVFLDPVADGNGGYSVDIQVKNTSASQSMTLNYLEFMVKATIFQLDKPLEYVGPKPREVDGGLVSGNPFERIVYLHYRVHANGQALAPGGTWTLSTIKFGPPVLTNQAWGVTLAFHESDAKSRLKTTAPACTTLKTTGSKVVSIPGTILCSNIGITFKVAAQPLSCSGSQASVRVGLNSVVPGPWKVRKLHFVLTFDLDPGVAISGVSYPDWPTVDCDYGCLQPPDVCWEISPDGKTLSYCFITLNTDPVVFDLDPEAFMLVEFSNTGDGCVKGATTTFVEMMYINTDGSGSPLCIPPVEAPAGFPQCGPAITGKLATEAGSGLEDATVKLKAATCPSANCTGACPDKTTSSAQTGTYGFCSICANCAKFDVVPEKNNDPLNGVSTFDLVLINKHILGLEILSSPYKIIAADANGGNTVTTADIVVLRKLILGLITHFPNNISWRFVDAAHTFPNPSNPFQTPLFPQSITCLVPPATDVDFVAVKVGDVNGNAVTSTRPGERPTLPISFGKIGTRSRGGVFTVPVTYTGERKIEALQMGLHFDPSRLELLGPSKGALPDYTADNFGLTRAAEGDIRTLWLSPTGDEYDLVAVGTVLFHLTFRARTDLPDSEPLLLLDDAVLDNAAWEADGSEYALVPDPAVAQRDEAVPAASAGLRASVRPNPSSGEVLFSVHAPQAGPGRIALFDAFGKMIFIRRVEFAAGDQDVHAPEAASLPPGVYVWRVFAGEQKVGGHLIRH